MDKLSVDGSEIAGPARLMSYYVPKRPRDSCDILLCSLRNEPGPREFLVQCGVETVCFGRRKFDLRALADLQRLAREWKPEILHLHGYASWTIGRIVGRRNGIPVVVQEHFVDDRVPMVQRVADWALRKQQQFAIAVSGPVKEFMIGRRYLRDTPVEVIWNGVPTHAIRSGAATADVGKLRHELDIPARADIVGIVGRLAEEKGHEYFLEIAAKVAEARLDVYFVIVGEGPQRANLEQKVAAIGLRDKTHFAGYQADVVPWVSLFSVALMTSRREGFPAVPLEYLAAGTPVVMTDLDVFRGVYTHEKDVLKVPLRNSAVAAEAVLRLLGDPALVKCLLENAQELLQACSVEAIVPAYSAIYARLLRTKCEGGRCAR